MRESGLRRAWNDTISAQKTVKFMWLVNGVWVVSVGAWLFAIAPPSASPFEIVIRAVSGGLIGLITSFAFLYVFSFVRAPYRQRDEALTLLEAKEESNVLNARVSTEPFISGGMAQLRIWNLGNTTIKCQGDMRSLEPQPTKPEILPYSIRWQGPNPTSAHLAEIVGGSSGVLEVAQHRGANNTDKTALLRLLKADGEDNRFNVSTTFNEPVLCEIAILCEPALAENLVETFAILDDGQLVDFTKT